MCKNPLISIIIPVYNAEHYLKLCLDSVLLQSFHEIEVILVDDGSTDNSPELCRQYAEYDSRICFLHQPNAGVSAARNRGLKAATGEFILFLDADDLLAPALPGLSSLSLQDLDLVLMDVQTFSNQSIPDINKRIPASPPLQTMQNDDAVLWIRSLLRGDTIIVSNRTNLSSVWAKLYRRDFLLRNGITFPKGIPMGEDQLFNIMVHTKNPRIAYWPVLSYYYRYNEASAVHRYNPHFQKNDRLFHTQLQEILLREHLWESLQYDAQLQQLNGLVLCLANDIFHPHNLHSRQERKQRFLSLVSRKEYRNQYQRYHSEFGPFRQLILLAAEHRCFGAEEILFGLKGFINHLKTRLGN